MDLSKGLVLDTSICINLLATQRIWDILACVGGQCAIPEQVLGEVQRHPVSKSAFSIERHPLSGRSELEVVTLSGAAISNFFILAGGDSVSNLGDGEAASIALAVARGCAVALDERKARRIARERFPTLAVTCSMELLELPALEVRLGKKAVSQAVADALSIGRMNIPKDCAASTKAR
ncbi:MAG: hypothetical protein ACO1OD_13595 [Croceibacterium sp.]